MVQQGQVHKVGNADDKSVVVRKGKKVDFRQLLSCLSQSQINSLFLLMCEGFSINIQAKDTELLIGQYNMNDSQRKRLSALITWVKDRQDYHASIQKRGPRLIKSSNFQVVDTVEEAEEE